MKIAIIGCGWLGKRLAKHLSGKNHHLIATTTSPQKVDALKEIAAEVHVLDLSKDFNAAFLSAADVAIFSLPVSRHSWFEGFKKLDAPVSKTIFFSSTGIYPQQNGIFSEEHSENLREDLLSSEKTVSAKYPNTVILRLGGLMGDERSLQRFYAQTPPPDPQKRVNHIHYEDLSSMAELLMTAQHQKKIYNLVAPEHPTVREVLSGGKEGRTSIANKGDGRIISPDRFITEFNYKFIHPNPKYF